MLTHLSLAPHSHFVSFGGKASELGLFGLLKTVDLDEVNQAECAVS